MPSHSQSWQSRRCGEALAAKDYIWDSQAAKRLEDKELDRHYRQKRAHYEALARETWENLKKIAEVPGYLKHDDLWDSLLPILTRDAVTLKGFEDKRVPLPMERGGAQWIAWFTHYVAEKYLETTKEEA